MFYWIKTNRLIKWLFSGQIWSIRTNEKKIYLTFDDGPTPEVTDWVLSILEANQVKATFFCIGENIQKYPEIFQNIIKAGHQVGNHTFNHIKGWNTTTATYLENIAQCQDEILKYYPNQDMLFRPPYGKITPKQSKKCRKRGYKIIMWDVLSADFDAKITPEKCLQNATSKVQEGSIIVFHDSVKAQKNLRDSLPQAIQILKEKGFVFETF